MHVVDLQMMNRRTTRDTDPQHTLYIVIAGEGDSSSHGTFDKVHGESLVESSGHALLSVTMGSVSTSC